nr:MAG TPA: TRAF PROTEIN, TRAO PROTEIN, TRAN ADHESION, BACTERIAL SECRETION.5A [Caudoviricetes sp.]
MRRLYATSILLLATICTACNSSPYRSGYVEGKHLRMEGRDTTYVVLFGSYNWLAVWKVYSAVVSKEDYYNVNKGDLVEFDVEAGKNAGI